MRVTIDVSAAINGKGGIGRYAATLTAALAEQHSDSVTLFGNETASAQTPSELADLPLHTIKAGYKPWRMAVWAGQVGRIPFDRLVPEGNVFHATEHLLLPLRKMPTVLTVHDLIYKLFPAHHKKLNYWYLNAAMPVFVRRAAHIITVSQQTKADLMRLYGTPAEKISVVYEAAAPHFKPQSATKVEEVRQKYDLPDRYLLTLGVIEPRKNLPRLIEVLAVLRRDDPDLRLVVVGSLGWLTESFFAAIKEHGQTEAVIRPGFVPDDDLPAMIAGAVCAVQPSVYEGFGLPVLEAMACGTPVACSNNSSLGEISGEAAVKFDPDDIEEMAAALRRLLDDAVLRDELSERGLEHAATFSWERAARETWAVYEQVAAGRQ